jgi:hypothetical protein
MIAPHCGIQIALRSMTWSARCCAKPVDWVVLAVGEANYLSLKRFTSRDDPSLERE